MHSLKRRLFHKPWALISTALIAFVPFIAAEPATAVTNFTVTVVASGGVNENSNWTYVNGQITPTASVSINASDIVSKLASGPLVIYSGKILVNANVIHSTANTLTFKSTGNIIVGAGLTIQSQAGDIVFHSDSDANNSGHIRFGWNTSSCTTGNIATNGGDIIVGGGADPTSGNSAAQNDDVANTTCPGGTPPLAGVGIYSYTLNAGGGDISVRGGSPNLGSSLSVRAVAMSSANFQTTGMGDIYFYGDGSLISQNNAWGIATGSITATTDTGYITLEARGNPSGPTNARGMSIGGASTFTSNTGDVSFIDRTNGAIAGYTGINLGASISVTTNGDFSVQADEISQGGALTLDVDSVFIGANTTSSFTNVYSTGVINAASSNVLRIGSPGNTSAITIAGAITSGGPLSIEASAITINQPLTATGSTISFTTTTGVTQNSTITTSALNLMGTATYNSQAFTVAGGTAQTAFTATYDSQGGSAVSSAVFRSGSALSFPSAPTRSGYDFQGWAESATGSVVRPPYTPPSRDLTLFGQWSLTPPPVVSTRPESSVPQPLPVPTTKVSSVEVSPGKTSGSSRIKMKLSNSTPGSIDSKVEIKLFDTAGKLLRTLTVPVTDDTGSLQLEVPLPIGEFVVQARTVNEAGGSSQTVVQAAPLLQKSFFTRATGNRAPVLAGTKVASPIGFAGDSAALSPSARAVLKTLATKLRSAKGKIALTGFAARQGSASAFDKVLSTNRARAVASYLKGQGISIPIFFAGYGAISGSQGEGFPRKVEIRLIK